MSTITTNDDNPEGIELDDSTPQGLRAHIRKLEKENREAKAKDNEVASLKKELALSNAGLKDLNESQRKALLATHEGETTPEALRKTAENLKFVEPVPEHADTDQKAHQQIANAQTASTGPQGDMDYEQEMRTAKTKEDVINIAQKHGKPIADQ